MAQMDRVRARAADAAANAAEVRARAADAAADAAEASIEIEIQKQIIVEINQTDSSVNGEKKLMPKPQSRVHSRPHRMPKPHLTAPIPPDI